ncbi:CYFA0S26e00386g1_1 [Cyberlindnera fabianii]|uniref:CYFA0S26e00386g1_1 n=1 Tax=Cyberlindnera fabianii TaxID=36022 RepID=A0A061BIK1_CYBFA|nr:Eukaryotic translation initiation factor 3 subunit D [Cyberlindnera fabianii]CDR46816.1 CYFA0S26e00386g1_1 [Cyberlindnera fabianii]
MSLPFSIDSAPPSTWGPPSAIPESLRFSDIPYAPFSKADKLGKAADWQAAELKDVKTQGKRGQRDYFHAYGASSATQFGSEEAEKGDDFEVVDNSSKPIQKAPAATVLNKRRGGANNSTAGAQSYQKRTGAPSAPRRGGAFGGGYGGRRWRDEKPERVREASIKVDDSWSVVSEVELNKLTKLNFQVSEAEDLGTYGAIKPYKKTIERSAAPLKAIDAAIYNPTASDDPVIQSLNSKKTATVYSTDSVVAQLMCATRSVYSWDIIVTKKDGVIFLDKREGSQIDKITVDENAVDAPSDASDSNIDNASNLSLEAVFVNQNFVANAVVDEQTVKLENPNPFHQGSEPLLSKGYKYRKFTLGAKSEDETEEPVSIVIRTEYDAKDLASGQTLSVKASNEFRKTPLDWKTKINTQRGAIMAAELKNNNNKFSKWAHQALLAGVDTIKLGFVSRVNFKDNTKHQILGVASYRPQDLAMQINLSAGNGWGIVKSYIDIIAAQEDGQYVILRKPNDAKLVLYRVPEGSLQDE